MDKLDKVDLAKLLGFGLVTEQLAEKVDFQNETFGGRLGAKVGDKTCALLDLEANAETGHD
jgi:hypothetical protein